MKGKKMLSLLSAGTIACAMLAALPVSAAGTAVTGDIDQDGVITGHDTAMISRYLADDAYTLTEEQLKLADINGDGTVDQTDADLLHAEEVYPLGALIGPGSGWEQQEPSSDAALKALCYYATYFAGSESYKLNEDLTQVELNLLDADADGEITILDSYYILRAYDYLFAGGGTPFIEGRYDYVVNGIQDDMNSWKKLNDIDF